MRVVLVDADIPLDLFESQIRHFSGSGISLLKIIYFLKLWANVDLCLRTSQEGLIVMLCRYDPYNVDRIYIKLWALAMLKQKKHVCLT